ncbi:MAG: hypothetical protein ACJ76V_09470 [Thermoleophilaceae bacterium]
MSTKVYTLVGWIVWRSAKALAKWKIGQNRVKLGAAGVIVLVLLGGVAAAKGSGSDD